VLTHKPLSACFVKVSESRESGPPAAEQAAEQPAVVHEPAGKQVDHQAFALHLAFDTQQPGTQQFRALALERSLQTTTLTQPLSSSSVDEHDAAPRVGPLPASHQPCGAAMLP
jgi:hypothetical protein